MTDPAKNSSAVGALVVHNPPLVTVRGQFCELGDSQHTRVRMADIVAYWQDGTSFVVRVSYAEILIYPRGPSSDQMARELGDALATLDMHFK